MNATEMKDNSAENVTETVFIDLDAMELERGVPSGSTTYGTGAI